MKLGVVAVLISVFVCVVGAWSKEDLEIFSINDEVKKDLGEDVTFYSWLELKKGPKSSYEEINKAYRKLSRKIHPDKIKPSQYGNDMRKFNRMKKRYTARYQRLSIVGEILRSKLKDRYDFFLQAGFPKYKNNAWLYEKFRPGLGSVVVGLFIVVGVFQYFILRIQTAQNRKRLDDTIFQIKRQAWPSGVPPLDGSDRKLTNQQTGKTFLVKIDGSVHLVDPEDSSVLHSVNPEDIVEPTLHDTIIIKFPTSLWNMLLGKLVPQWSYLPPLKLTRSEIENRKEQKKKKAMARSAAIKLKEKKLGEKTTLPNGKTVYSRKKKN